jgi:hypothetical protein
MNRDKRGRFVEGHHLTPKKWTRQKIVTELVELHKSHTYITESLLDRLRRNDLEGAINRYFDTLNKALVAANVPIYRNVDKTRKLKRIKPLLNIEKAICVAWLSETSCTQSKGGSWSIRLETPEKELAEMMIRDFEKAYNYHAKLHVSKRDTFKADVHSKAIIEELMAFASKKRMKTGKYKFELKSRFFIQKNININQAFLQRFFDCEGSVSTDGNCIHIQASNTSPILINNISEMLHELSIANSVYRDTHNYRLKGNSITYKIRVNKQDAVRQFSQIVGFGLSRKREKLLVLLTP